MRVLSACARDKQDLRGLQPGSVLHEALPLGFKAFCSNKSPGYHEGTWQAAEPWQAAVPGCLALWLGEEGKRASGALPSSGNKVRLCLLLKCRGEISAS